MALVPSTLQIVTFRQFIRSRDEHPHAEALLMTHVDLQNVIVAEEFRSNGEVGFLSNF